MVSDFQWGTANAQPVTLSFWAFSSLTGTFGGSIANYATDRSYPFSYSIPTANTWVKIIVTIPGDTAGTWVMSGNGEAPSRTSRSILGRARTYRAAGAWGAGDIRGVTGAVSVVATNGAAFYLTGVKLEVGSVATPFNRQSLAGKLGRLPEVLSAKGPAQQQQHLGAGLCASTTPISIRASTTMRATANNGVQHLQLLMSVHQNLRQRQRRVLIGAQINITTPASVRLSGATAYIIAGEFQCGLQRGALIMTYSHSGT